MPVIGIRGELIRRVEAIIEVARLLYKAGYKEEIIQKTLIDPMIEAVEIRIEYGVEDTPKEETDDNE